jgi:hypothetical protein
MGSAARHGVQGHLSVHPIDSSVARQQHSTFVAPAAAAGIDGRGRRIALMLLVP